METSEILKTLQGEHLQCSQSELWVSCMFTDEAVVGFLLHICAPWEVSLFSSAPAPNTWSRTTQKVHSDRYKLSVGNSTNCSTKKLKWARNEKKNHLVACLATDEISSAWREKKKLREIKRKTLFLLNRITLKYEYIHILLEEAFSY